MDVYNRIKELLKEKRLTAKDMCSVLSIQYSRFNTSKQRGLPPRVDEAYAIAQYLGVSVDYLYAGKEFDKNLDFPKWQELIDEQRVAIKEFLSLDTSSERFETICENIHGAYHRQKREKLANGAHG